MKRKLPNEDYSIFEEVLNNTPEEDKLLVSRSLEIANQIITTLEEKGMLQKDLASLLDKKEPEISKWLCGFHNFTLKSLVKIEAKLGERIITTPKQAKEEMELHFKKYYRTKYFRWLKYLNNRTEMQRANLPLRELENKEQLKNYEKPKVAKIIDIKDFQKSYINTNAEPLQPTGTYT